MKDIKPLTSLRGIFALWVLGYHLHSLRAAPMTDLYGLLGRGYLGVDFFFLLSGFILAGRYGNNFNQSINFKAYFSFVIIRAGRLLPLNIIVTIISVIGAIFFGIKFSGSQIIEEILLLHRWPGITGVYHAINGPAWSISTEWLANLIFPVFSIITLSRSRYVAFSALIISSLICLWLTIVNNLNLDISHANSSRPFIRCAAEFTIGMLIFRWHKTPIGKPKIMLPLLSATILAALHFGFFDLGIVALMSVLIPLFAQDQGRISRLLSATPLVWLGNLSFSIYLTQEPILRFVRHVVWMTIAIPFWETLVFVIGTISLTILVSWAANWLIERPWQVRSKQLARAI